MPGVRLWEIPRCLFEEMNKYVARMPTASTDGQTKTPSEEKALCFQLGSNKSDKNVWTAV